MQPTNVALLAIEIFGVFRICSSVCVLAARERHQRHSLPIKTVLHTSSANEAIGSPTMSRMISHVQFYDKETISGEKRSCCCSTGRESTSMAEKRAPFCDISMPRRLHSLVVRWSLAKISVKANFDDQEEGVRDGGWPYR